MNTVCTHCQAINRIPDDRIEDAAKCGRCGHDLFDGEVINATGETLDKLLKDDLPVLEAMPSELHVTVPYLLSFVMGIPLFSL